jgi:hypothetical protein
MGVSRSVNERQLELLRRIAANDRPLTPAEHAAATSVYALRSRGLVATSSLYHFWTATVTEKGRFFLEHGCLPGSDPPGGVENRGRDDRIRSRSAPMSRRDSATDDLIERVHAAGGQLRVPDPSPRERSAWRRAIHAASAHPGLPAGMRIRYSGRNRGPMTIAFVKVDEAADPVVPPTRVAVPARLIRPHALIAATRDAAHPSGGWIDTTRVRGAFHLHVSPKTLQRALRIGEGLVREAERRGHCVERTAEERRCAGGLGIVISGHRFEVTLVEETDRYPHVPSAAELERARRNTWLRVPEWDRVPSGRLQLRSGHGSETPLASDRKRRTLDDRLGDALDRLERRAEAIEELAREVAKRREQTRLQWEEAMRVAKVRLVHSHRADHLARQAQEWRHATNIREFVTAVRARMPSPWGVDPKTEAWLTWAGEHADSIDPLLGPLYVPEPPEATPAALQPFLNGWSPYGAHH